MALLNILQYPDPRLKKIAKPITLSSIISNDTKNTIDNMFETMYQAKGIGLAATQVDIQLQIITIDVSEHKNQQLCLINPQIIDKPSVMISHEEGCLSFPGVYAKVKRYSSITIEFLELSGQKKILHADNLLSICIQHEIDHLNGITFFDHLSPLKQKILERKLNKLRKQLL